jgi:hypothetical protein
LTIEAIVVESSISARLPSFGARYWFSFARALPRTVTSLEAPGTVPAEPTVLKVALVIAAMKSPSMPEHRTAIAGSM